MHCDLQPVKQDDSSENMTRKKRYLENKVNKYKRYILKYMAVQIVDRIGDLLQQVFI